jgi:hypothetical protein
MSADSIGVCARPPAFQRSAAAVDSSAGKNASMESSAAVRSSAGAECRHEAEERQQVALRGEQLQRNRDPAEVAGFRETAWVRLNLGQQ